MFLTRLIYASTVSKNFASSDIENILGAARKYNVKQCITGMLCFNRKYFLQSVEGSRDRVNALYQRILADPRHSEVVLLDYQEVSARDFGEWSMGYVPESSLTFSVTMKFSGSADFNPYQMSGHSAHEMLKALKESVPLA